MTYTEALTRLSAESERKVLEIFRLLSDRRLDRDQAVALIASVIARANSRAVALADLSLASTLMLELGRPVPTLGLVPPATEPQRLRKAATTLLAVEGLTTERVARLGRVEPLEAASRAYSDAISGSPLVSGWTRGLSAGACELCTWWWRDGRVWQADHRMPTHKGCTCTQQPVVRRTRNYQTDRQANEAARTNRRRNAA